VRGWSHHPTKVSLPCDDERDYRMKADPDLDQAWRLNAPRRLVAEDDRRRGG
jgi:hypothetical protein